jgi:hypothetical protein
MHALLWLWATATTVQQLPSVASFVPHIPFTGHSTLTTCNNLSTRRLCSSTAGKSGSTSTSRVLCTISHQQLQEEQQGSDDYDAAASLVNTASNTNTTIQIPRQHFDNDNDCSINLNYPSKLHNIHVETILSPDEAFKSHDLAVKFAKINSKWNQPDADRHETYPTCDFAMDEASKFSNYLKTIGFQRRIWKRLSEAYGVEQEDLLGFIDFFCVCYTANDHDRDDDNSDPDVTEEQTETMDRLEAHRDGSILSFTVLLSPPEDFEGGGTFFDALRDEDAHAPALYANGVVRPPQAGDAVLHSGKLLHGADVVTKGQRVVLVGFVDLAAWCETPGALHEACKQFGRMDVAQNRYDQQLKMTTTIHSDSADHDNNSKNCKSAYWWKARNKKWLPKVSCFHNVIPAMDAAKHRAEPERQRRFKLQAEDLLLRSILSDEARPELPDFIKNSDISVL